MKRVPWWLAALGVAWVWLWGLWAVEQHRAALEAEREAHARTMRELADALDEGARLRGVIDSMSRNLSGSSWRTH